MENKKVKKENRLVVGDKGWAKDIPEWLLEAVKSERLILGLAGLINPNCPKVGDAEVIIYLMTASLRQPLSPEHTNIYLFLTTKIMKNRDIEVPEDIRKEELSEWEKRGLEELRSMIYTKRGGDIQHPLLEAMKEVKKEIDKEKINE